MRTIDADELIKFFPDNSEGAWTYNITAQGYINAMPTIDLWHYPSKGEYPPLLEYVFCKLTDDTYEVGYYQGQIDGEPEWAFTCFLGDVVAWQYIIPPSSF